jgi:hypothetical protein
MCVYRSGGGGDAGTLFLARVTKFGKCVGLGGVGAPRLKFKLKSGRVRARWIASLWWLVVGTPSCTYSVWLTIRLTPCGRAMR